MDDIVKKASIERENKQLHPAVHAINSITPKWKCPICLEKVSLGTKCPDSKFDEYHIAIQNRQEWFVKQKMKNIFGDNYFETMFFELDFKKEVTNPKLIFVGCHIDQRVFVWLEDRDIGLKQRDEAVQRGWLNLENE